MTKPPCPRLRLIGLALVLAAPLAACQTVAPATASRLSEAQIAALRDNGFVETAEGWELSLADQLLFAFDSSAVQPDMAQRILRIGAALRAVGIDQARVEGHTDSVGTAAHNQRLSLNRARAVGAVLASSGFASERLVIRGWGETRPVADNGTDQGRSENRRVVIIVTSL